MGMFLDVLCEEKLSSLIIEGKATDQQLSEAWVIVLAEYYELGDEGVDGNEQCILSRDIQKLHNHLYLIDVCVQYLLNQYSESIAESVRKLGYSFRPTSYDPVGYVVLLNAIVQKSKTKFVQLQQLLKQLEDKMQEGGKEKPKRETFERNLLHYEEMQGTTYDIDEITVSKYRMLEKKYNQKVEQLKQLHAKQ